MDSGENKRVADVLEELSDDTTKEPMVNDEKRVAKNAAHRWAVSTYAEELKKDKDDHSRRTIRAVQTWWWIHVDFDIGFCNVSS